MLLIGTALLLAGMSVGTNKINVKAAEISQDTEISQDINLEDLATCDWLTDDAKQIVMELCEDADAVSVYLPNVQSRSCDEEDTALLVVSEIHNTEEVDGVIYEDREETLIALATTLNGSFSASGQKYGVAAANTVSITWSYTDAVMLSDLKIKFNSMSAQCTSLPTQSATVTKMDYSVRLETTIGTSEYLQTGSVSYPSSGVSYPKALNSGWYAYGGNNGIAMLTLYYNNGYSSTYTGSLGAKH